LGIPLQDPAGTGVPILENHLHDFPESWNCRELWDFRGGNAEAFRKNPAFACGFRFRNRTAENVFVPSFFSLAKLSQAPSETTQSVIESVIAKSH